jgi:hypothetical protein
MPTDDEQRELLTFLKREVLHRLKTDNPAGPLDPAEVPPFDRRVWCREVLDYLLLVTDREGDGAPLWVPGSEAAVVVNSNQLWLLLADELMRPVFDELFRMLGSDDDAPDYQPEVLRVQLVGLIDMSNIGIPPSHRCYLHALVALPYRDLIELRGALAALRQGEVRPLLQPAETGQHGATGPGRRRRRAGSAAAKSAARPYSWERARSRAVEHIFFLVGQGLPKEEARGRVAEAAGASDASLREWERVAEDCRLFELAQAAGEIAARRRNHPESCSETVDEDELLAVEGFQAEPLGDFGKRFRATFGPRYLRGAKPK